MITKLSICCALLAGTTTAEFTIKPNIPCPLWKKFQKFKIDFNIEFESMTEDHYRFSVFKENFSKANELTKKSDGKTEFGITKFAHLTGDEFKKQMMGYKPTPRTEKLRNEAKMKEYVKRIDLKSVKSKDWRDVKNAVTPVKNQGQCGSCWAFSATQAVETGYFKKTGMQKILAPQQTVTCDKKFGDYACNGGDTYTAYEYMRSVGGIELETDYPYYSGGWGWRGWCRADKTKFAVKVGATTVISKSEAQESHMLQEIQESSMSICVDASPWQMYTGGVIDRKTCGTTLDHCVHLVGYKTESNANDDAGYWIVKNSWGDTWGEEGYIRVKQGENACGVASEATIVEAGDEGSMQEL